MRFLTRSLIGMFLLALTVGLLASAGYLLKTTLDARRNAESRPRPMQERVFTANVVTLEAQSIAPVLIVYGEVQSRRSLELRAQSAGRILELAENFEEGGSVVAGQLLLRIDPVEALAARDSQRAALADAEVSLAAATRALAIARDDLEIAEDQARLRNQALERQQSIDQRGLSTATAIEAAELSAISAAQTVLSRRSALSQAQSQFDQASNTIERQRIALAEAERKLANTEVRAEFSGLLSGVSAVQGGVVTNNEMLGRLIDPQALEVSFRVSTAQFTRFLDEQGELIATAAEVVLDVPGKPLSAAAKLSRVGAAVGEGQTGRLMFAQIEPGATGFRSGDFVAVRLNEPALDGVALLPAAAVDSAGKVLVLGADDRLEERQTEVLRRQGADVVVLAAGLEGLEVVTERSALLGVGLKVRPVRPGQESQSPVLTGAPGGGGGIPGAGGGPGGGAGGGGTPTGGTVEMVKLTPERRAELIAKVERSTMTPEQKERTINQLKADEVSPQLIQRIEQRAEG
jgi:multidrug efflux pump subunit AcrA (membrane-fusion protein)